MWGTSLSGFLPSVPGRWRASPHILLMFPFGLSPDLEVPGAFGTITGPPASISSICRALGLRSLSSFLSDQRFRPFVEKYLLPTHPEHLDLVFCHWGHHDIGPAYRTCYPYHFANGNTPVVTDDLPDSGRDLRSDDDGPLRGEIHDRAQRSQERTPSMPMAGLICKYFGGMRRA